MAWRSRLPILISEKEANEKIPRISHREIARQTSIRQATVSEWMNWGVFKRLDADVVERLAKYLDCSPAELYEWIEDEQGEAVPVPA
jgi:DNA-binding Xre family transcriptional regulator